MCPPYLAIDILKRTLSQLEKDAEQALFEACPPRFKEYVKEASDEEIGSRLQRALKAVGIETK